MREDHGEFSAAEKNELPKLIEWTDLKGSLHNHSNWSDGHNTLEEIADYMEESGPGVLGDHRPLQIFVSGKRAGCETAARANQGDQKDQRTDWRRAGATFRLLAGSEVDILKDRLDFDDDLLAELDVVVASLHVPSKSEAENTKRMIRAAENPFVHIIGHLTGRLLLEREPYPVNVPAVIDACAATGTWLELNCNPRSV